MATEAQIAANRDNARKSTGPRTEAGKAKAAQNAVRHGLLAEQVVIKGEDVGEFEFYREQLLEELSPAGVMESVLAERAVGLSWRLRRAERIQAEVLDSMLAKDAVKPLVPWPDYMRPKERGEDPDDPNHGETALGRVVIRDFVNYRVLDRLGLYERRIERSLFKTMHELQELRLVRQLDKPANDHRQAALDAATPAGQGKSEARSSKSETSTNVQNPNDRNKRPGAGGSVKAGLPGLAMGQTESGQSPRQTAPGTATGGNRRRTGAQLCETKPIDRPGTTPPEGHIG